MNNERKSNQMLVFEERGNRSTRRKLLDAEYRTNKLNPHMKPSLGIEHWPHWWETSAAHYECVVRKSFVLSVLKRSGVLEQGIVTMFGSPNPFIMLETWNIMSLLNRMR